MELGKRERQVYETIVAIGEASVNDVLGKIANPPSYSAIRATLNLLVDKKWLKFRKVGQKYLYRPAVGKVKAKHNAIRRLISNVFADSATDAVAALLDVSASKLSDDELQEMIEMIQDAKQEKQS
jgi:predicted transcriptional regulator